MKELECGKSNMAIPDSGDHQFGILGNSLSGVGIFHFIFPADYARIRFVIQANYAPTPKYP